MKRVLTALTLAATIGMFQGGDVFARGGGGGGGHGGGGGGAGHAGGYGGAGHAGGYGGYGGYGGHSAGLDGIGGYHGADGYRGVDGYGAYGGIGDYGYGRADDARSLYGDGFGGYGDVGAHPTSRQLSDFLGAGGRGFDDAAGRAAPEDIHMPAAGAAHDAVADRAATGRQDFANHQANQIDNRQQWQDNRSNWSNQVRNDVANRYPRMDFWANHPNWAAARLDNAYGWSTWGGLNGWLGWGWGDAIGYDYGENVYYNDDQVYYGDQPIASAADYASQAEQIATSVPPTSFDQSQWMSLGVFAVTQDGQATGSDPTLFIQLAVSKDGSLAGSIKNQATNDVQSITGSIDRQTQRAAWMTEGHPWPVMETGVQNLTQDSAPALVHFEDGSTQQWLLVRLNDPNATAPASTSTAATP